MDHLCKNTPLIPNRNLHLCTTELEYMKKVCSFDPEWCSITNEDKTYNLTIMLLTHFAFLGLDFVLEKDHRVHPIIPGKLYELAHLLTLKILFLLFTN